MNALVRAETQAECGILASLQHHAEAARGAYADATERALRSDVVIFTTWCRSAWASPMPATAATVAAFIEVMGAAKAPATVRRYVSSVATFHRAGRGAEPDRGHGGEARLEAAAPGEGEGTGPGGAIEPPAAGTDAHPAGRALRDLRNRALLALAYDTLCRRSEMVGLLFADLDRGADGAGTIVIRRSKTDQEGTGMIRYVAADTMRHVIAWTTAAGHTDGTLFRAVRKGARLGGPLDGAEVSAVFRQMAKAAGLTAEEAGRISGHSTRVGAAQDMVRHGIELPAVMQAGGWRTAEMVSRYTARLDARRSGAAKLAVLQDRE